MLIGRYYHALEQKGRLSIPASFRRQLDSPSLLTIGLDGCLFLFARTQWQHVVKDALSRPLTKKNARDWVRLISNNAVSVNFDKLGRILVPDYLINFAGLTKKVCVVGSINRVEIWDQDRYHAYLEPLSDKAEVIAESLETDYEPT